MNEIVLTNDQQKMCEMVFDWFNDVRYNRNKDYIVLSGYAGTGKTVSLSHIIKKFTEEDGLKIGCATYTGKASIVLKNKIPRYPDNYCGTIHGLIYRPILDDEEQLTGFERKEKLEFDLVIIDECSMIDEKIFKDLVNYRKPVIFIGDSAQLPPVSNSKNRFNVFKDTSYQLTEIHRQVKDSPIIKLSMMIRNGEEIKREFFDNNPVVRLADYYSLPDYIDKYNPHNDEVFLCGMNNTRVNMNKRIRSSIGYRRTEPTTGEIIINLTNNHHLGVMNGQTGIIKYIRKLEEFCYEADVDFSDDYMTTHCIYKQGFNKVSQDGYWSLLREYKIRNQVKGLGFEKLDMFDFGYCLSVHKSQGDQWNNVYLISEKNQYQDYEEFAKWLYTAVTRTVNKLVIFDKCGFWNNVILN